MIINIEFKATVSNFIWIVNALVDVFYIQMDGCGGGGVFGLDVDVMGY